MSINNNLTLTHLASIPYLFSVACLGIAISTLFDKKMKSALVVIGMLIGMYMIKSISVMAPDYDVLKYLSLTHYFDPTETLIYGQVDLFSIFILIVVMIVSILTAMIYFEKRDISIS